MGQKIIPLSLRLNKNKNWNSQWIVENNDYSNILNFDINIRKYFEIIFNSNEMKLIKINFYKISNNIYIYIYIQKHPKIKYKLKYNYLIKNLNKILNNKYNIKIFLINLIIKDLKINNQIKKIFKFLKKNNKLNYNLKKIIYILTYAFYTQQFNIISKFIKYNLKKKKIHKGFINFIDKILYDFFKIHTKILGYKIQIKGRINGLKRSKKMIVQKGKIPLNTLNNNIYYEFEEFDTPSGICSLKFWFFLKK